MSYFINALAVFIFILLSITRGQLYSDTHDYDAYGTRLASNENFVVLAQNDGQRYFVSMAPFGARYGCSYAFTSPTDYVMNVAVGRHQNASQLSFVYLRTNDTNGSVQKLGIFTFSREPNDNSTSTSSCNRQLGPKEGEHEVMVWQKAPSEMSTMQVDPKGKYAYGFLSHLIFIYDIENKRVQEIMWKDLFPPARLEPHALDVGETNDGVRIAILAGYVEMQPERACPSVYLFRLNPPRSMTLVDNQTLLSDRRRFVHGRYAFAYSFDYVMSVSIHDRTQQVLVSLPQTSETFLFSFNSTNLILKKTFPYPARSSTWLDDDGSQAGLLLATTPTLPWSQSRMIVINTSLPDVKSFPLYVLPNNQQTFLSMSSVTPIFIRLLATYDNQPILLTSDGIVVLVSSSDPGCVIPMDDINNDQQFPELCPAGTYKSVRGPLPCTVCPTQSKSPLIDNSVDLMDIDQRSFTIECAPCALGSFCPLGSVNDVNISLMSAMSQAYAYPTSGTGTSFDDVLINNMFYIQFHSRHCIMVSPLFWALVAIIVALILLLVMGILYNLPKGMRHYKRLERIFRRTDLIGNGELWFGGLISFAIIILIIFAYWFSSVFVGQYPIETSGDAYFACDLSLRNAQLSSSLQLLTTIKSNEEQIIFDMLNQQEFILTVDFIQTGFNCSDIVVQEMIGMYTVTMPILNCFLNPDNATRTVAVRLTRHQIGVQFNLTGSYYIGGARICLTGHNLTRNDSLYVVHDLFFCQLLWTVNQTLSQQVEASIQLTKVINRTETLANDEIASYSGIWIPTYIEGSYSDQVRYEQLGVYLRYLATHQLLQISLSETQFYVKNTQDPIARTGETLFHNVLFTTTAIGLFGLALLLFKLSLMPMIQWIFTRKSRRSKHSASEQKTMSLES